MNDAIEIQDGTLTYIPNGAEVATAMENRGAIFMLDQTSFFKTLRLLCLAGF